MYYIRISQRRINPAFGYVAELMQFGEGPVKVLAKSLNRDAVMKAAKAAAEEKGLAINPSFEELKMMAN